MVKTTNFFFFLKIGNEGLDVVRFEAAQIKAERSERGNKSASRDLVPGAD